MSLVSIDLFKKHVRADDTTWDDALLEQYLAAAEEYAIDATNRPAEELVGESGELPAGMVQAIIMIAGHWYNQREEVSGTQMHSVPYGASLLISRYCRLV